MRLFVALVPPAAVVDELRAALAGVPGAAFPPTVRWAGPERWHLTLAFLGPVDEGTRAALADRLAPRAEGTGPFRLSLAGTGHFDHRVWWAGVRGDTAALHRLAGSVREAARCVGLPVEDRPYRPHLTLARTAGDVDLDVAGAALAGFRGSPWTVRELALMRSRRDGRVDRSPVYETLSTWPLRGGDR